MEFLKEYLTDEAYQEVIKYLNNEEKDNLSFNKISVKEILDYLKEYGIENFKDIFLKRIDICFKDVSLLENELKKYDKKLIKFIFNNDIGNLVNLNI